MAKAYLTGNVELKQQLLDQLRSTDELVFKIQQDPNKQGTLARTLFSNFEERKEFYLRNLQWELQIIYAESLLFRAITQYQMNSKLKGNSPIYHIHSFQELIICARVGNCMKNY